MSWSGFAGPMGSGPEVYYHIECDFSAGAITYTALFPYTSSHLDSGNTTDINVSVYAGGTFLGTVTIKDTYTTWDVRNFRNTMSINGNTYYYDSNYMQRSFSGYSFPSGTYDLTFNFSRPSGSGANLSGAGSITFPSVSSSGTGGGSSAVYTASFKIDGEIVDLKSFTDGGGVTVPSAPASSDWTETEEYILTPNANGGTVSGTGKTTVTKEYSNKFACWYSMSDGKEYQPGDTYSYPANTIMEAQYGASSPKNTYSHSFSGIFFKSSQQ